ncbi:MAG: DedA family protein [Alphaproteobacteria bacterium]|nr:DedA family protein [Alphaproteobacteria bacterium]
MKIFSYLYDKMLVWARHRHAPFYLSALSFAESSFFPIPPDVMLAPMSLAQPKRAFWFAFLTTAASIAGALLGYAIGYFAFGLIEPFLRESAYWAAYEQAVAWDKRFGLLAVFLLAGFTPVPFKILTIAAGAMGSPLLPFLAVSFISRGGRFFLVAGATAYGGSRMEEKLRLYIDRIGWACVVLMVLGGLVYALWPN